MSYRDCVARIAQAAGRALSDAEIRDIYERVHKAALDIKAGRTEAKTGDMFDGIVQQAAQRAADDLIREAAIKQQQAHLQVAKLSARLGEKENMIENGVRPLDSVDREIFRNYDGKTDVASLEQTITGYKSYFNSKLAEVMEGLGRKWFGLKQDSEMTLNLVREMLGEKTGDPIAEKAGKAWKELSDEMHATLREKGGVIGKLDESYVPQGWWSQETVSRIGRDKFVERMLPVLEKTQAQGKHYVDDLGQPWSRERLTEFLGKAWDTIATNGHANAEPGQFKGSGGIASRHAEHRQIHFPDAESVLAAWKEMGGKTVPEILFGHTAAMARDISLLEWGGPNPQLTYRTMRDQALKAEVMADPTKTGTLEAQANRLDGYFDYVTGKTDPIAHPRLHRFVSNILPINVMAKLGGAMWASLFGDKVMFEAVRHMNALPMFQTWRTETAMLNPLNGAERRLLMRQGLMLDELRGGLARFGEEIGNAPMANKGANLVMQITGMNLVNNARKGALGASLFDAIGHELQSGKNFADLHQSDARILKNWGITEADWKVWQQAKLQDIGHGNDTALTPEAISRIDGVDPAAKRDAIVKLLGAVNIESEFGIVTPGMKEHAQFNSLGHNKSVFGEIGKTVLQFKSFPWAQFNRMLDAVANQPGSASKAAMTAYLVTASTLAGAMIMQTRDMLSGKDPRAMDDWRFWASAFFQGGSLGLYGDFIYSVNSTRYGSGPTEAMLGPTVGPLLEMGLVQPLNAAKKAIEGKDSHLAAQTLQDAKSFVPGNNMWFTKAALDHLIWQQAMEALSPNYLASIRSKTAKEYGQNWWWNPGQTAPDRPPDLERAMGR